MKGEIKYMGASLQYSFLMSVYYKDKAEYLSQSIQSMLNQTAMPDEIVIVKDGPLTGELNGLIESFCAQYPGKFHIVALSENKGLGLALNEGLYGCKNELVARMDSDDICLPERCELQLKEFEKNGSLDIVGTMIDEFDDDPKKPISSRNLPIEQKDILNFAKKRSPFNHVSVMFKKSSVIRCHAYSNLRRNQDVDLFARMLHMGCHAININRSLLLVRTNAELLMRRKSWENTKSYIKVIYGLWKMGFSSFFDFGIVAVGQLIIFSAPTWFQNWIYKFFLRG